MNKFSSVADIFTLPRKRNEVSIVLTDSIKDTVKNFLSFTRNVQGVEKTILNSSIDTVVEFFRHSVCLSLDLVSTLDNSELQNLAVECAKFLRNSYSIELQENLDKSQAKKEIFLQSCMLYIANMVDVLEG